MLFMEYADIRRLLIDFFELNNISILQACIAMTGILVELGHKSESKPTKEIFLNAMSNVWDEYEKCKTLKD